MEPIRERIGDDLVGRNSLVSVSSANSNHRRFSVFGRVNAVVVAVFSLRGRPPEVEVVIKNVAVVDGHHLDRGLFHDGAAKVLDQCPEGISAVQNDREGQPRGPGDYNVVLAEVRKPHG